MPGVPRQANGNQRKALHLRGWSAYEALGEEVLVVVLVRYVGGELRVAGIVQDPLHLQRMSEAHEGKREVGSMPGRGRCSRGS